MAPAITAEGIGIRFARNRRRRIRIRELVGRQTRKPRREFWALRDVSFSIDAGEAVGVVGGNGHGKSTLLRLIAGVLLPDEGQVTVEGGVAPLIELTAGFEGHLTARDNIYLLGGLHGLSRERIDRRFQEIVDFSEVGDFLDTPVRHFSSGMKVRLGFAVVTQLDEPTILVDEALAVGDRKFRDKCYDRMEDMVKEGRTLFLVSHSERDLTRFCTRGLYLRGGKLLLDASIDEVLEKYAEDQDSGGR